MTFKEELMEILKEEVDLLKTIKELAYQKTEIIINSKIEELSKISEEEEKIVDKMAGLEKKRLVLLDTWGVDKKITLSEIIEKVPEDNRDLIEIWEELTLLLIDIKDKNNLNNELLKDNLEWLDFNINLLTQTLSPNTYDGKKSKANLSNKNFFDRKV